jgi:hypothetical protein
MAMTVMMLIVYVMATMVLQLTMQVILAGREGVVQIV